jgi:Phospholipase_D-nuclease N-terminal
MMQGMGRLYMFTFGLELLLVVVALISCLSAEEGEVRALPRMVWVIIILLFPLVGSIAYFAVGRPVKAVPQSTWRAGGGFPESTRPAPAPDDDPAFLARLEEKRRRDDEELMRKWEADLKRREDDLRKKEDSAGADS